jgi:uroporphyrinogen III methyltransferase/synthase
MTQERLNALLVELGGRLETVVRLKGGDPFVFGRGGEEALALEGAGIAFEVVPGVSSAHAVPAYAGIPVTQRGVAAQVTFVTGHEDPTRPESAIDWASLAATPGTLVFLMGVGARATYAQEADEAPVDATPEEPPVEDDAGLSLRQPPPDQRTVTAPLRASPRRPRRSRTGDHGGRRRRPHARPPDVVRAPAAARTAGSRHPGPAQASGLPRPARGAGPPSPRRPPSGSGARVRGAGIRASTSSS